MSSRLSWSPAALSAARQSCETRATTRGTPRAPLAAGPQRRRCVRDALPQETENECDWHKVIVRTWRLEFRGAEVLGVCVLARAQPAHTYFAGRTRYTAVRNSFYAFKMQI